MRKKIAALILPVMLLCASIYAAPADNSVKVPVILYHNITERLGSLSPGVHIATDVFRAHMQALRDAGYTAITYQDYYAYVTEDTPLPEKPVIITFDDGYISNYEIAYPILKNMGMKATIFVITSMMGMTDTDYPHFSWEQAREMEQSGVIDIQSHSHTHASMPTLDAGQIAVEARLSKYLIETHLNKTCDVFAYPYGHVNQLSTDLVRWSGYKLQNKLTEGANDKAANAEMMRRITVLGNVPPDKLLQILSIACNP